MSTFQQLVILEEVHGSMGQCRASCCNLFFRVGKAAFSNFIAMAEKKYLTSQRFFFQNMNAQC
jgi:hypothetical protein